MQHIGIAHLGSRWCKADRAGPAFGLLCRGCLARWRIGEILKNRTSRTRKKIEAVLKHPPLKRHFVGYPERTAQFKRDSQRFGRLDLLGVDADQTDLGGWNAGPFNEMCKPAHGARAGRLDRDQQDSINPIGFQDTNHVVDDRLHPGRLSRTHEREMMVDR